MFWSHRKVQEMGNKVEMAAHAKKIADALVSEFETDSESDIVISDVRPLDGGFRFSQENEAYLATTQSPGYDASVTLVISVFDDESVALDFFTSDTLSEIDRFENIGHILYEGGDDEIVGEMAVDLKSTLEIIDGYAASWQP